MSIVQEYRVFLYILTVTGMYPFSINPQTQILQRSRFSIAYVCILNSSLLLLIILMFVLRVGTGLDVITNEVQGIANFFEGISFVVAYFAMIASGLITFSEHIRFLNDIVVLDRKMLVALRLQTINSEHFTVRVIVASLSMIMLNLSVNLYVSNLVLYVKPFWYNYVWMQLSEVLVIAQNLPLLHLRYCALLLRRRFDLVIENMARRQKLAADRMGYYELMSRFCELCELKKRLEKIFGLVILLHVLMDLLVSTVTIYMTILYALGRLKPELLWMSILLILLIISKQIMLFSPLNDIGNQASKLRSIVTHLSDYRDLEQRASLEFLLIRIQHMKNTRYISAYGFFNINHALIFHMLAGIISQMLVLLQFQQRENNEREADW